MRSDGTRRRSPQMRAPSGGGGRAPLYAIGSVVKSYPPRIDFTFVDNMFGMTSSPNRFSRA